MKPFFFIRSDGQYKKLDADSIIYIESKRNRCSIRTNDGILYLSMSLKKIESLLPQTLFCRVHKSFIISIEKLKFFEENYIYVDGYKLPFGQRYKSALFGSRAVFDCVE